MAGSRKKSQSAPAQASKENDNEPRTRGKGSRSLKASTPATGRSSTPLNVLDLHQVLNSGEPTRQAGKSKSRFSRAPSTTKKSRMSTDSDAPSPSTQITSILNLSPACLAEVFKRCDRTACRKVLPLVCKQWAAVLKGPSVAWETLELSRVSEIEPLSAESILSDRPVPQLEAARLEQWVLARAPGTQHLTIGSLCNPQLPLSESKTRRTTAFRSIVKATAPFLRYISINGADLGCPMKWTCLRDLASAKGLTHLHLASVQDGPLTNLHGGQLAAFKDLKTLILSWEPAPVAPAPDNNNSNNSEPQTAPLPRGIFELKNLEVLNLSSHTIGGDLPREISKLSSLKELAITCGKLVSIPSDFAGLDSLTKLSFAHNRGTMMQNTGTWLILAALRNLVDLNLTDSGVKKVQDMLKGLDDDTDFTKLERLNLSHNRLGPLPEINDLMLVNGVSDLNLSNCSLAVVPANIANSCALRRLDLSCNQLVDLPEEMENCQLLEELNAADNSFPALPAALKDMECLEHADFSRCCYLEVSRSLTHLVTDLVLLETLKLDKYDRGVFQTSSKKWLAELSQEFYDCGRGNGVVSW